MILTQAQINEKLTNLSGWKTDGKTINHTYTFKDFISAIAFVNALVEPSEKAGHHPDITISYNKVTINLSTHDEGGITEKDFNLAEEIANIAKGF